MDDRQVDRRGPLRWVAIGIAAAVFAWVGGMLFMPSSCAAEPPARSGAQAARAGETKPLAPPAPKPKKLWKPPRFKARQEERMDMVRVIQMYGLNDKPVLDAMSSVPRHEFVPRERTRDAYADTPLPIGFGQTISQPYIVAEMTRLLNLKPDSKVLEIGTGSGYQAAVLTEFTANVYSIEIVKPLADAAKARLKKLGYEAVQVKHGDGYYGWPEAGPFDGIIVTAAAGSIPPPLIKQLVKGGRMIIPVGPPAGAQHLMLVEKDAEGRVRSRSVMGVRFVPFTREDATTEEN